MNMILKSITAIVALAATVSILASSAFSYECRGGPPESWFQEADIVFSGRVLKKSFVDVGDMSMYFKVAEFSVEEVYKGNISNTVTVGTVSVHDGPGVIFLCGEEYMVYARKTSGTKSAYTDYWTMVCTPTRPLEAGVPDTPLLEEATFFNSPGFTGEERNRYWEWMGRCLSNVKVSVDKYCTGDEECLKYLGPVEESGSKDEVSAEK
jgi:hypothetical protein